jgi:hypothetical protein
MAFNLVGNCIEYSAKDFWLINTIGWRWATHRTNGGRRQHLVIEHMLALHQTEPSLALRDHVKTDTRSQLEIVKIWEG